MQQRLVAESKEERATRLENVQPDQHLPPFDVQSAMRSFHQEMSTIDTPTCSTCMEKFPGMKVNGQSECLRCARDKNVPKLYSLDNKTLGRARDPRANSAWLSKLTERNMKCLS